MNKVKPPITVTQDSLRLYKALLEQVALNESLQKELLEAADVIKKLTERLEDGTRS